MEEKTVIIENRMAEFGEHVKLSQHRLEKSRANKVGNN